MFGPQSMACCSNEAALHMSFLQAHPGMQVRIWFPGLFLVGSKVKLFTQKFGMTIISMLSAQIDAFFSHLSIVPLWVLLLTWHLIVYSFFPQVVKLSKHLA